MSQLFSGKDIVHRTGDFVDRLWSQEEEGWDEVGDGFDI
jgi:hypothetical protein